MANFKQDILEAINGEEVETILIPAPLDTIEWGSLAQPDPRDIPIKAANAYNRFLSLEEALPLLDYEYDDGYGGMDCHDVVIWTKTQVFYIHEYDGSTCFHSQFRNPTLKA